MIYKQNIIKALVGAMATLVMGSALAAEITGAGASSPYPVYVKWSEGYKAATGNRLDYQAIGSTGGIRQLKAKTVTFAATDVSMSGADLDKEGWLQFPAVIGGTVPVFNLDGFNLLISVMRSLRNSARIWSSTAFEISVVSLA
jgi:phosphate transport system substrate-binding protein